MDEGAEVAATVEAQTVAAVAQQQVAKRQEKKENENVRALQQEENAAHASCRLLIYRQLTRIYATTHHFISALAMHGSRFSISSTCSSRR